MPRADMYQLARHLFHDLVGEEMICMNQKERDILHKL
jgi:hypothetical protein